MPALVRHGQATGQTPPRRARGQALIEMAIVSMLLLTLVIGIIDFGFFFFRYVQAANCVREAARSYVTHAYDSDLPECGDGMTPTVSEDGDNAVATVSFEHDWLALDTLIPGLAGTTITASSTMRIEPEF